MPDKGDSSSAPPTDHGEVYSSDAPGGPYKSGVYYPDTGHQTQIDKEQHRHVSRDWEKGKPTDWHSTDDSKRKGDEDRHKPWWK